MERNKKVSATRDTCLVCSLMESALRPSAPETRSTIGRSPVLLITSCLYEYPSVRGPRQRRSAAQILLSSCRQSSQTYCLDCNETFLTPFHRVASDLDHCCCQAILRLFFAAGTPRQSTRILFSLFRMQGNVTVEGSFLCDPLWVIKAEVQSTATERPLSTSNRHWSVLDHADQGSGSCKSKAASGLCSFI